MKAPQSARLAVKMGYTNVHLYQEGLKGWGKGGHDFKVIEKVPDMNVDIISPEKLKGMLDRGEPLLLVDIRDNATYSAIRIGMGKVLHIRMVDLVKEKEKLPKQERLVVIDQFGKQVVPAGNVMKSWKLNVEGILDGGIMAWQDKGLPVTIPKSK